MADFSRRSTEKEMMDDFSLDPAVIHPILSELEIINRLLGGYNIFFDALKKLSLRDEMLICDWGCGGGDSLRKIAEWSRKVDLDLDLIGIDASEAAIDYAEKKAISYPEIKFIHADVLSKAVKPKQFDIIISSLFTHHFDEDSWIRLVQKMIECARDAVIINDLHRHWLAYYSIAALTAMFSKSPMVKNDAKLSVLRGFTRKELEVMLQKAGISRYTIKWMWAFRWQIIIYK